MIKKMLDKIRSFFITIRDGYDDYIDREVDNEIRKQRYEEMKDIFDSLPSSFMPFRTTTTTTYSTNQTKKVRCNYITTKKSHNGY
jgi:hypothetical protein